MHRASGAPPFSFVATFHWDGEEVLSTSYEVYSIMAGWLSGDLDAPWVRFSVPIYHDDEVPPWVRTQVTPTTPTERFRWAATIPEGLWRRPKRDGGGTHLICIDPLDVLSVDSLDLLCLAYLRGRNIVIEERHEILWPLKNLREVPSIAYHGEMSLLDFQTYPLGG